ncbi:MAG: Na(+)/H(+) antiporter NhaA [Pseudomonadota bacterium]
MSSSTNSDRKAGLVLALAALAALVVANSSFAGTYRTLLDSRLAIGWAPLVLEKTFLHWINDGLMAVFFLLVGLEMKRELVEGELAGAGRARLPLVAALGGMLVPAVLYAWVNSGSPTTLQGWPIPAATDIAFTLGVLAIVGTRVPPSVRAFLLGLAIIDDLGAIVLIAILFTADLSLIALGLGTLCAGALLVLNRYGVTRLLPYLLCGVLLWLCVLKSGVHATLAGVFTGMVVPLRGDGRTPARALEHALHPWVTFGILPVFALANAGVPLSGMNLDTLLHPVTMGTAVGLFVGKQLGVFGACFLAIRSGWCTAPAGADWKVLYGASVLTGIGFTMSLFIGSLAFPSGEFDQAVRTGVLLGSALSIALGLAWLLRLPHRESFAP